MLGANYGTIVKNTIAVMTVFLVFNYIKNIYQYFSFFALFQ